MERKQRKDDPKVEKDYVGLNRFAVGLSTTFSS
jgi:hypothetical protein